MKCGGTFITMTKQTNQKRATAVLCVAQFVFIKYRYFYDGYEMLTGHLGRHFHVNKCYMSMKA